MNVTKSLTMINDIRYYEMHEFWDSSKVVCFLKHFFKEFNYSLGSVVTSLSTDQEVPGLIPGFLWILLLRNCSTAYTDWIFLCFIDFCPAFC